MKVRSRNLKATIDGYTLVPVFNYLNQNITDDLSWQGCNYAAGDRYYNYDRDQTYADYSPYVLSVMRKPMGISFNLTP